MHILLNRQLRRLRLSADSPPDAEQWATLLERIDRAFTDYDEDREILERSLAISSTEMRDLYNTLRESSETLIRGERDKLRALMNNVAEGIITFGREGLIDTCNAATARTFGYDLDEMQGMRVSELLADAALPFNADFIEAELELTGRRKDGSHFPLTFAASTVELEEQRLYIAVVRDFTARKEFEEMLRAHREQAISANKAKSAFLANMSHEIRTPLNGVLGLTSVMMETPLNEEQIHILETIRASGDALLTILNDILDFSKVEAGKIELDENPLCLQETLQAAIELMTAKAKEKGLELRVNIDPNVPAWVCGDAIRIRQIVVNLLSNAVKFTERGFITLRVRPDRANPNALEFCVYDTGIGFEPNQAESLFQSFNQADASVTRKYGGTGLGLAICKQLAELMGGRIWAQSRLGVGSAFHFVIQAPAAEAPLSAADDNETDSSLRDRVVGSDAKVLLVEDNSVNQMVALKMLERLGYKADVAENGLQAVAAAQRKQYDLLLMDVQMPEMDGVTATSRIRTLCSDGDQPYIIAMTANALVEDRKKYLAAGMDDYLSKPVRLSELRASMERYIQGH